jgi:hypothetical protein
MTSNKNTLPPLKIKSNEEPKINKMDLKYILNDDEEYDILELLINNYKNNNVKFSEIRDLKIEELVKKNEEPKINKMDLDYILN